MIREDKLKMSRFSSRFLLTMLVCGTLLFDLAESTSAAVTNLVRGLMKDYEDLSETFLIPSSENGYPLEVGLQWHPTNILSFNEQDQYIEFRGYITVEWYDPALRWNPNTSDITLVNIPTDNIWRPKLIIRESQTHEFESVFYENNLAFVRYDGKVLWSSYIKTSTFCQILQQSFPYDRQACTVTFSSAANYESELLFTVFNDTIPNKFVSNGAWEVVKVVVPDCPDMMDLKNRTALRFVVDLKRRRQRYYVTTLVVPCFILSAFTSLVFLYPRVKEERFPMATMNLLALFVYQEFVSSVGPPAGSSLLGTFVFVTILEATVVSVLSILSARLSENYPLCPSPWADKNTSAINRKPSSSDAIEFSSDNVAESNTDTVTLAKSQRGNLQLDSEGKQNHLNRDNAQEDCVRDVITFDQTAATVLIVFKFLMYIIFAVLFGSAAGDVTYIMQCRDEYYFP